MKTKLLILLIGIAFVGCNESAELENGNQAEHLNQVDSTNELPASQLMVDDSIRKHKYKGSGIR